MGKTAMFQISSRIQPQVDMLCYVSHWIYALIYQPVFESLLVNMWTRSGTLV